MKMAINHHHHHHQLTHPKSLTNLLAHSPNKATPPESLSHLTTTTHKHLTSAQIPRELHHKIQTIDIYHSPTVKPAKKANKARPIKTLITNLFLLPYPNHMAPQQPLPQHTTSTKMSTSEAKSADWDAQSTAPTLAASETASVKGQQETKPESMSRKVWEKIKKAAREHHESVNGSYQHYYAPGTIKANIV
jgi:hypothetical protein